MYTEWLSLHDGYVNWGTSLLSCIHKRDGMEALREALKQAVTAWFKPNYEGLEKASEFRQKVEMFAMGLRAHGQPIEFEEDDERVCLTMRPCGAGERLLRSGGYEPPRNFSKIEKPNELTYGQSDFPIYCSHSPMMEILQIEWGGRLGLVLEPPEDMTKGGCKWCVYKDPEAVPEKFYTRLGKKKKKA